VGCVSVMKVDSEGHLSRSVGENVKQEHLIKVGYFSCLINYAGSGHAYRRLARERERERERTERDENTFPGRFERKARESGFMRTIRTKVMENNPIFISDSPTCHSFAPEFTLWPP
jgi:hypothetical protein